MSSNGATEKKLRATIYADVKHICKEAEIFLNVEYDEDALDVIGELVWKKLLLYASDLEAYQRHAKRFTINTDDVKLLFRRNPSLREFIERECSAVSSSAESNGNPSKRKRKTSVVILE